MTVRALFCGDRDWKDRSIITTLLLGLMNGYSDVVVIEGEAPGADSIARDVADGFRCERVRVEPYPADWTQHGRAAGPIRNRLMLSEGEPHVVFAFHDDLARSKGTKDMVQVATKAGVPVYVISRYREAS